MALPWIYPVRIAQALFGVIVIGLTGYVVSLFYNGWSYSDTVNFLLFLGCWTAFVAVPYLVVAPIWFPRLAHRFVIPAVEVITMIFWFAGFIALGAILPAPRWCHGSACSSLQAATVFGAIEWVLFAVTSYFSIVDLMHHRGAEAKTHTNVQMGV
ncbi:hypothetical protein DTO013E5_6472 [Penicillium roqueforti]|uniref:MARVEL-like domain n=1 Tax=Penicillium roqueforti (strain FM164) TaxID=1365484 RepID=W6QGS5_PENRF|nr:uncharacterized protein LCP9604111_7465 [Penicillium roqueforti]CDM35640.1 MARVEL-like domain [Penicillium roqueforti FM164]KAF9244031.1 hypothetical protein LCP9604111_7465 [Penicillium roqueforti]KAI1833687.1 hypothetical protein CBS147337_5242 [Penicillium roqueforti]KAI2670288.1 hypothetical protein CBS147355_9337 [Penicillium roqueforti]KAI2672799.1 hypothetical protein LCP963914a_9300 [Penicillium roqueforti]